MGENLEGPDKGRGQCRSQLSIEPLLQAGMGSDQFQAVLTAWIASISLVLGVPSMSEESGAR